MKLIFLLAILTFNQLIGMCQGKSYESFIIKYEHLEFHFKDSVYPFTIFIEPNGFSYFQTGHIESSHEGESLIKYVKEKSGVVAYKDTFVKKSNKVLKLESYYPQLIKHDSSVINHYPHEPNLTNPIYELEYSYRNYNLKEPNLIKNSNVEIIRLIVPEEYSGVPKDYSSIRLDLKENKLFYSKGVFEENSEYKLFETDSCLLNEKNITKIKDIINLIDFDNEYYFTELGVDFYPKFLIEYKTNDKYYVIERQLYSPNKKDRIYSELYYSLLNLKKKYIKQK